MNLVIGSTGSIGNAVVSELSSRGLKVRALVRDSNKARKVLWGKVDLLEGSAESPQLLTTAFEGVDIVFNCLNLPYPEWSKLPAIHKQILNAAKDASAKMVFPGNVYIYGHAQSAKVSEDQPLFEKGKASRPIGRYVHGVITQ